jgi:hypothetical protein
VFPGQLRPTFESYDRTKRIIMTVLAVVWGVGVLATLNHPAVAIFFGAFVVEIIVVQVLYTRRINAVRRVSANLGQKSPADLFVVGNARIVGPDDSGVSSVPCATVVVQVGKSTVSLWKPGVGSTPFIAIPKGDSAIEVIESKPPRLHIAGSGAASDIYLALFASAGLTFERSEKLFEFARNYGTR